MIRSVTEIIGNNSRYFTMEFGEERFSFSLNEAEVKSRMDRMGFMVLYTNTDIGARDALRMYREKDVVEKVFMHMKPALEPMYSRTLAGTRAKIFLSTVGYSIIQIIGSRTGLSYNQVIKLLSGIKELVYSDGSHSVVELTKEQRDFLKKLSIKM